MAMGAGRRQVRAVLRARRLLQRECEGRMEVTLNMIRVRARQTCSTATISRILKKCGICWRPCREKPHRSPLDKRKRMDWCLPRRRLLAQYWLKKVDIWLDYKRWNMPISERSQDVTTRQRVRGGYGWIWGVLRRNCFLFGGFFMLGPWGPGLGPRGCWDQGLGTMPWRLGCRAQG